MCPFCGRISIPVTWGGVYQDNRRIAEIGLVDFEDYNYLEKYGENLYDVAPGGRMRESDARIEQGCLEMSNVNIVSEILTGKA